MIERFRNFLGDETHLKEILIKGSSAFAVKALGIVFSFLFTIMIGRQFGATTYGIFALCINFLLISSMLVMLGLDTTFLKFTAHYLELKQLNTVVNLFKKILAVVLPVGLFLSVAFYFMSDIIAVKVFSKPNLAPYFRITTFMILPWSLIAILGSGIRGFKDVKTFTFLRDASAYLFALIILLIFQWNSTSSDATPVYAYLYAVLITLLIAVIRFTGKIKQYVGSDEITEQIPYKKIFEIAFPLLIVFSTYHFLALINSVMLGMLSTESDVGIYNVALRISNVTLIPLIAINSIAGPKFAASFAKNDYAGINKIVGISTKLMFLGSLPLLIICFVFPNYI
ncbi:MAG: oligosaccharide flippase family protein, partial [Bacteroidia bacterium]|nr:oligosaccharide flippase family protein [Bacteroidia bacterium]